MRHASGQFYGVSAPVARYVARSASVLYKCETSVQLARARPIASVNS